MSHKKDMPGALADFCERLREKLKQGEGDALSMIEKTRLLFPELSLNRSLFQNMLRAVVHGEAFPDVGYPTMFDSEIILFNDPERYFTMRLFIWGPGQYDPVHDHNAWGVIGPVSGHLEVINYDRVDDGRTEGRAVLRERDRMTIAPGEDYYVLPMNAGIHRTGNPSEETIIQVSIYGRPSVKRDFINGFDPENDRVYPIFGPKMKKRKLAVEALEHFSR